MENPSCLVCSVEFSETVIPKVCDCGYSICNTCLNGILQAEKCCPKCKKPSSKLSVEDYPTNYSLDALLKNFKNSRILPCPKYSKYSHEKLRASLLLSQEKVIASIAARNSLKNLITYDLSKIDQIIESDTDTLNVEEINKTMIELQKDLNKVENVINCCKSNISVSFSLNEYKTVKMFLFEILIRLHKGEALYAVAKVCGQLKYGEISCEDELLMIHALTLTEPCKTASWILLDDFKKCIEKYKFFTFFEVSSCRESNQPLRFFFKMTDSALSLQFIKLCTGETGPVYKGSTYVKGDVPSENPLPLSTSGDCYSPGEEGDSYKKNKRTHGGGYKKNKRTQMRGGICRQNSVQKWAGYLSQNNVTPSDGVFGFGQNNVTQSGDIFVENSVTQPDAIFGQAKRIQSVLKVSKYMLNGEEMEGAIEFDLSTFAVKAGAMFSSANMVVTTFPNGLFQVYVVSKNSVLPSNVVGINSYFPEDYSSTDYNQSGSAIEDCGIAFQI